jgi:hypothetical protein
MLPTGVSHSTAGKAGCREQGACYGRHIAGRWCAHAWVVKGGWGGKGVYLQGCRARCLLWQVDSRPAVRMPRSMHALCLGGSVA